MILLAQAEELFRQPTSDLYQYVTNMENYGEWFPGVVEIASLNALEPGEIGKQYVETLELPIGKAHLTIEVVEAIPGCIFITKGDLQPLLPRMEMRFYPESESECRFQLSYYSRNDGLQETGDIIATLREDLSKRIEKAMKNLHEQVVI
ncbi:hypothetical protein BTA51_05390 [Hahella sp. CCB-MM4]|uniref:SRPBCC family protein n=1 Tax=Hahella sp. (strain CCB-MM4) TaxID=1926491 RepID=UPI000B9AB784|nr:SRPBCC family protein [Hahella sp. CCB-MM4]OZG74443.1 hypothetical protein BTA51_05390 [Hahella sp. CCB-MM4]